MMNRQNLKSVLLFWGIFLGYFVAECRCQGWGYGSQPPMCDCNMGGNGGGQMNGGAPHGYGCHCGCGGGGSGGGGGGDGSGGTGDNTGGGGGSIFPGFGGGSGNVGGPNQFGTGGGQGGGMCNGKLDLVFVVDASNSVLNADWVISKSFTSKVISKFSAVGLADLMTGWVTFGRDVSVGWKLNDMARNANQQTAISSSGSVDRSSVAGTGTNTAGALSVTANQVFIPGGDRELAGNVAIVITDGKSNVGTPDDLTRAIQDLHRKVDKVIAIGVGMSDKSELLLITNGHSEYAKVVNTPEELLTLVEPVIELICPIPVTQPTAPDAGKGSKCNCFYPPPYPVYGMPFYYGPYCGCMNACAGGNR